MCVNHMYAYQLTNAALKHVLTRVCRHCTPTPTPCQELGWRREDLVVSTKVFWGGEGPNDKGLSRKHIIEGTRNCLKRLQLDYV